MSRKEARYMRRFFLLLIDTLILFLAIILSYLLLNYFNFLENYERNIDAFFAISWYIIPIYLMNAYVFGMANLQRKSTLEIWYTVFIVSIAFNFSLIALVYFRRDVAMGFPRSVMLLGGFLSWFSLTIWRLIVQKIYIKAHGQKDVMIIGLNPDDIETVLYQKFRALYQIKYVIEKEEENLEEKLAEVNYIFVSDNISETFREKLMLKNNEHPELNLYFIPKISDISLMHSRMTPFGDIPVHLVSKLYLKPEEVFVKRGIDIFISIFMLIFFSPFILLFSIIIKMDGGSIFFIQERLTKDRKTFRMYKLRTMKQNAEKHTGPTLSTEKDKRITGIGHFLRTTRLDEIPQFWNILKGDMSIVGPRPERAFFAEQIEAVIPEFKYRLNVKAGLTGLAQITGKYNTDFKKKLYYDLYYINNFSILRDFLIMLQTIKVIFWKEHVEGAKEGQPIPKETILHSDKIELKN